MCIAWQVNDIIFSRVTVDWKAGRCIVFLYDMSIRQSIVIILKYAAIVLEDTVTVSSARSPSASPSLVRPVKNRTLQLTSSLPPVSVSGGLSDANQQRWNSTRCSHVLLAFSFRNVKGVLKKTEINVACTS